MRKRKTKITLFFCLCMFGTGIFSMEVVKGFTWNRGPLVIDHQGNMYLGYDSHTIAKYSPKGELLLKIGRKGEGPGDIKRLGYYAFNPKDKMLYVTEYYNGNRRVSRFTTDGKYHSAWPFEFNWSTYDVVSKIAFDSGGNVFLLAEKRKTRQYKEFILTNTRYHLLKFSAEGKFSKEIYSYNKDSDAYKKGNFTVTIPFQNWLSWLVYQDKIIVKEQSGEFIQVFSTGGELLEKIPFPVKREKLTEVDFDAWEKRLKSNRSIKKYIAMGIGNVEYWRENLPFPTYKPNSIGPMYPDFKGNLYIETYATDRKKPEVWFKINLQTGKANKLPLKPGEDLSGIRKGYFYLYKVMETEDDEVETITRIKEEELSKRPL